MHLRPIVAAAVALALSGAATAQDLGLPGADPGAKVRVADVAVDAAQVAAGGQATIRLKLAIEPGWHIYGLEQVDSATTLSVPDWPQGLSLAAVTEAPGAHELETAGIVQLVHEDEVTFALVVDVAAAAEPGPRTVRGVLTCMACDANGCLPDSDLPFEATFEVTPYKGPRAWLGDVALEPSDVPAGGTAGLRVQVRLAPHAHVYAQTAKTNPTTIEVATWPPGLSGGRVTAVPPAETWDEFGVATVGHRSDVTFTLPISVAQTAAPGERTVRGEITWMACDENGCDLPVTAPFEVTLRVPAGSRGTVTGSPAPPDDAPVVVASAPAKDGADDDGPAPQQGLAALLLQAMGAGLLTLLTPCVFPMLPITVSFFSKQKGPALPRSLIYGSGWIVTIVGIGIIFRSTIGDFAQGPWFNLAVGVLFVALALSLFGLFDLRLPGFLTDWTTKRSSAGGHLGAFFMAVTLALTSFSCSMPFLAAMLLLFEKANYLVAVAGMTVFAATLATPFVLCSLFPAFLSAMPRAGSWMNAIKVTMGFVELAAAFKFLRTFDLAFGLGLLPRGFVLAIWAACAFAAALYLFGYLVLPHDTKAESIGVVRLLFALLFLACGIFTSRGAFGFRLTPFVDGFIQTQPRELVVLGGGEDRAIPWVTNDWDGALARAVAKRRPVLFDFTGVG